MTPTATTKTATNGKKDGLASTPNDPGTDGEDRSPTARNPRTRKQSAPLEAAPARRAKPPAAGGTAATRTAASRTARPRKTASLDLEAETTASDQGEPLTPDEIEAVYERAAAGGSRSQAFRLPAIAAVLVIVILAAALVFFVRKVQHQDSTNSLRSSALTAASTYGGYLSSYDYHNLNGPTAPWTLVAKHATAKFQADFKSTSAPLAQLLTQYHATAVGKVIVAGVSSLSSSRAVVLLFVDQNVTNTVQKPNSITQPLRVELTMLRQHGQWFIDNLELPK